MKQFEAPIIVCNEAYCFMVAEQCHSIGINPLAIILEPVGRNTASAISLAVIQALKEKMMLLSWHLLLII